MKTRKRMPGARRNMDDSPMWDMTLKELGPEFVANFFYLDSQGIPMPFGYQSRAGRVLPKPTDCWAGD